MITIGVERLEDCWDEIIPLAQMHWQESMQWQHGKQPFAPLRDRYVQYERAGMLVLIVVRDDGKYAGHGIMYLAKSMHTQVLVATEDLMFLLPEYRSGGVGKALYSFVEAEMWRRGADEISVTAKPGSRAATLLERLGCTLTDLRYSKHRPCADSAVSLPVTESSDVCTESSSSP